ncbi:MAG: amidohydrolase [Bacilli bacterium]|nr:amidohydrolase [Bacilli bacterium]MCH4202233.1 amidohydrolase [Bacilli bacterium]MCH4235190.1 amidohydrolase [Bacilli bacterium]
MKIRFINARLLTMDKNENVTFGELEVTDNHISYVGEERKNVAIKCDREIDCQGNVLMPGFKNAHTHSAMTFLRSFADDLPLEDWLHKAVFPAEAHLKKGDEYHLSKVAIAEYLTSGITAAFDMYYNPLETARAASDSGFRMVCLGTVTSFRESVDDMVSAYRVINSSKNGLVTYRLGFHSIYTTTREILQELSKAAHSLKTPIFTHTSETEVEVKNSLEKNNLTPPAYIESLGLYDYGGGGFHCVHMQDEDFEIFKRHKLYVVTNPSSNTKLASGIPEIQRMIDENIPVAIGTDGPASGNCLDFFREMFLVTGLGKLRTKDASAVKATEVIKMATVNGALAMGLDDADVLAVNKKADIIMIDLQQPNMQPINNIVDNIVYSGSKQNVKMTMINGKILYEDNKFFLDESIEQIYQKAQEITDRIKRDMRHD